MPVFLWVPPTASQQPRLRKAPFCSVVKAAVRERLSTDLTDLVLQLWGCWDGQSELSSWLVREQPSSVLSRLRTGSIPFLHVKLLLCISVLG